MFANIGSNKISFKTDTLLFYIIIYLRNPKEVLIHKFFFFIMIAHN